MRPCQFKEELLWSLALLVWNRIPVYLAIQGSNDFCVCISVQSHVMVHIVFQVLRRNIPIFGINRAFYITSLSSCIHLIPLSPMPHTYSTLNLVRDIVPILVHLASSRSETKASYVHSKRRSIQIIRDQDIRIIALIFRIIVRWHSPGSILRRRHAHDRTPASRNIRTQQPAKTLVGRHERSEVVGLHPEGSIPAALKLAVAVEELNTLSISDVSLEIVEIVDHAFRATFVLEPHEARTMLIMREEDDSAVLRRGTVLFLEILPLLAQHLVLSEIAILTGFGAVRHVIAIGAFESRAIGACSAEFWVGRCTTGDSHAFRYRFKLWVR